MHTKAVVDLLIDNGWTRIKGVGPYLDSANLSVIFPPGDLPDDFQAKCYQTAVDILRIPGWTLVQGRHRC